MIIELNRVYILSAPKAVQGMIHEKGDYFSFTTKDMTYVFINKVYDAKDKKQTITGKCQLFQWKDNTMQAIVFYNKENFSDERAEKLIAQAVAKHATLKK